MVCNDVVSFLSVFPKFLAAFLAAPFLPFPILGERLVYGRFGRTPPAALALDTSPS